MQWLNWLSESVVGVAVRESTLVYATTLTCHALGMAVVVGIVFVVCYRAFFQVPQFNADSFDALVSIAWAGLLVNGLSGVILFTGDPAALFISGAFQLKMLMILLGGLGMRRLFRVWRSAQSTQSQIRLTAVLTALLWIAAIVAGRLIAYTKVVI